jgi:hypothetical protein
LIIFVHAGGEMGFVPNALLIFKSGCKSKSSDYHDDMNAENYETWLKEKLIPNLPQNSVVVTDNASYHNVQLNRAPTSASRKSEMKEWLMQKNIYPLKKIVIRFNYMILSRDTKSGI